MQRQKKNTHINILIAATAWKIYINKYTTTQH